MKPIPFIDSPPEQKPGSPPGLTRKIIEIATGSDSGGGNILYCLCDDGTLWMASERQQTWNLFYSVPQIKLNP
jgi:hypothetical protein